MLLYEWAAGRLGQLPSGQPWESYETFGRHLVRTTWTMNASGVGKIISCKPLGQIPGDLEIYEISPGVLAVRQKAVK